ncbi:hypothetical protein PtB15_7B473 [Puccinia triticina]|nr:hypothetical protein PtB15_7B473 [Puccinia triticina]
MAGNANRDAARAPHPYSAPPVVGALPRSPPLPTSPAAGPHLTPPAASVTRRNAIRRPARPPPEHRDTETNGDLELNYIEINGALVNTALGLTPTTATSPRAPTTTAPPRRAPTTSAPQLPPIFPLPPIRLSSLYNATPPLSAPPFLPRPPPPSRRRNAMIILIPADLPQELRDIQLDAALTQDDDST